MANGKTHKRFSAITIGGGLALKELEEGELTLKPLAAAAIAYMTTNLPDKLEPAIHSHHRQFFHGLAFAGVLGVTGKKLYEWQPEEEWQKALRFTLLAGGSAYLAHLLLDSTTPRALPLLGNL